MKNTLMLVAVCMFFYTATYAQSDDEPAMLTETIYILPKTGMNKQLEEGVAAHNKKFHAKGGDHEAGLRRVEYGNKSGWYVWLMHGTYASMDNRPDGDDHNKDWEDNVGKYVEEYGDIDLWSYNKKLSYGMDRFQNEKRYEVWAVYLKPWQYYRFNEAMTKIQAAFAKMGNRSFLVFNNAINRKGGPDAGIVWGYNNFADLERDSKVSETFNEIYGDGSWMNFIEEWKAFVIDIDEEHRSKVGM
ncbi:hypothetical protein [Marinigracilibium pacificum]|uniref:Uncharacterized protein n=1 Tax=Marinigracilibium pacificum TaxID=2729599 RepID=A0A848ITL6_9BACT|nr:hypothetical protein [Marinigracilibium pacificum]NMM47823.1 hypothetical protein [Marinigracilibium pacificum]